MIQIGTLRKWIQSDGSLSDKAIFKNVPNLHYNSLKSLFDNIERDIYKHLPESEHYNLYYTVGHHLEGKRTKASWQAQDIIPFDLDGIDLNRINEYPPIVAKACGFDLSKTAIVYSGNGIHILVQVPTFGTNDKEYIKNNRIGYKQLCERVYKACKSSGLALEKDTTAWDYARILRCPFTLNKKIKKNDKGELVEIVKECKLIQNNLEVQEWEIPKVKKITEGHALKNGSFPTPDHKQILKECDFFKWLQDSPEEVHEPHAYAMLSITGHFLDSSIGYNIYKEFSSPSINSKDYNEFLEQALRASNPRTCRGIEDIWDKCKQCPHYESVTSPILLKGADHIGTEFMGFTTVSESGKSKIRHYDDLVKYFKREHNYRFVGAIPQVYVYEDYYYKPFLSSQVKKYANDKFSQPVKETERVEFLKAVEASEHTDIEWLENKPTGKINFKNGVLDIRSGELLEHSPEYNFTSCLPYGYDPEATCPKWDEFIKQVTLEREDLASILHEYLGYILYGGNYKYHKALVLSGSGKNGKSTFINILEALCGDDNISTVPLTSLANDNFALSDMQGKLVNISEEEPPSCFRETGVFKNLTGDNKVRAQRKFKNAFMMRSRAKIVITYNELPFISDTSTGMRRRLLIVPFDFNLESNPDKVNVNIGTELLEELPGIFNKALEGWKRLEKNRNFTKSKAVEDQVTDLIEGSNPFFMWFNESVIRTDDYNEFIPSKVVYDNFVEFLTSNNEKFIPGVKKFSMLMKGQGCMTTDGNYNRKVLKGYRRIRLNAPSKPAIRF